MILFPVRLDRGVLQRKSARRKNSDLTEHFHPQLGNVPGQRLRPRKRTQTEIRFLQETFLLLLGHRLPDEDQGRQVHPFGVEPSHQGDQLHHHQQLQQQHHQQQQQQERKDQV